MARSGSTYAIQRPGCSLGVHPRQTGARRAIAGGARLDGPAMAASSGSLLSSAGSVKRALSVGAWRSLVARIVRDDEVGGSNPLAPTKLTNLAFELDHGRQRGVQPEVYRIQRFSPSEYGSGRCAKSTCARISPVIETNDPSRARVDQRAGRRARHDAHRRRARVRLERGRDLDPGARGPSGSGSSARRCW